MILTCNPKVNKCDPPTLVSSSNNPLKNLPGSLSLRDMQMIAQIKQLLPSARNISKTENYRGLLPCLIPLWYVPIYRTAFAPAGKPYWTGLLFTHKNSAF